MAHHKAYIKDIRQNEIHRQRNRSIKTLLKNAFKRFDDQLAKSEPEKAQAELPDMYKLIDRAASKGVIHKRTAARRKSQISRRLHEALPSA